MAEQAKPLWADSEPPADVLSAALADLERMPPAPPAKTARDFMEPLKPLSTVLESEAKRLEKMRAELLAVRFAPMLSRDYEEAFFDGDRLAAFALSERLAELARLAREQRKADQPDLRKPALDGISPCFRIARPYSTARLNQEQKFDLFAHDLQWVAAKWPKQKVKGRYADVLKVNPDSDRWLTQAEDFWTLRGAAGGIWKAIRDIGLERAQQWECMALRTRKVKDRARGIRQRRPGVHEAIQKRLVEVQKAARGQNTPDDFEFAYRRRERVWECAEMASGKPQRAADLYQLWTSSEISRTVVYDDLRWLRRIPEARPRRKRDDEDDE